jgi:tetrahydromethanopterin S-methyltransferase subunit F
VEDAVREGEASDRRTCVDLADATFEGRGAGFFASGTLSRRIVGVAGGMLNFLLLKRFMIRNVLKC